MHVRIQYEDGHLNACNLNGIHDAWGIKFYSSNGFEVQSRTTITNIEGFTVADVILVVGQTRQNLQ